jgi:hypothetical protein
MAVDQSTATLARRTTIATLVIAGAQRGGVELLPVEEDRARFAVL